MVGAVASNRLSVVEPGLRTGLFDSGRSKRVRRLRSTCAGGEAVSLSLVRLFEKLPVFWQPKQGGRFRDTYRQLIALRKQHAAFRNDDVIWLKNSAPENLVTFLRRDAHDEFVTVVNFSNRPQTGSVEVAHGAEFKPLAPGGGPPDQPADFARLALGAFEWRIYHRPVSQ
jgi:hypothetical protein